MSRQLRPSRVPMTSPGTPKASQAAITAVQEALGCVGVSWTDSPGYDWCGSVKHVTKSQWTERGCPVAVAAADAAAPHNAAEALKDAAAEAEEFASETYALDIFRKPSPEDYAAINALLDRERGHMLDGVAADCYRRAIGLTASRLREAASDIEAGQ